MISATLLQRLIVQLQIDWHGIHGVAHWGRVYHHGSRLARENGANIRVVQLFSIFHDSCRQSEGSDPGHGQRGASLASALHGTEFDLASDELQQLMEACRYHTSRTDHDDLTVKTCFDADRLDLGRVGIMPDPRLLCTEEAKRAEIIAEAYTLSNSTIIPENRLSELVRRLEQEGELS